MTVKRLAALALGWLAVFFTGIFIGADVFWAVYWAGWFFVVFMIPELYWAFVNARYTVSAETWRFESLRYNPKDPFTFAHWTAIHWVFGWVYFVFAVLLGIHLVFGTKLFIFWG